MKKKDKFHSQIESAKTQGELDIINKMLLDTNSTSISLLLHITHRRIHLRLEGIESKLDKIENSSKEV